MACSSPAQEVKKTFYKNSDKIHLEIIKETSGKQTWKEYYESGKLLRISAKGSDGFTMDGEETTYFEDGKIAGQRRWIKGIPDGREYGNFANGRLVLERFYKNGFRSGTWKFYNEDGTLSREVIFAEGKCRWDDETEIAKNNYYWKGKLAYTEEVIDQQTKVKKVIDQSTYDQLTAANPPSGPMLFMQNCASCHAVKRDLVGPMMKDVTKRRTEDWLYKMITNGDDLVKNGDPTAVELYKTWHIPHHPSYQLLDKAEVQALIDYLKTL